MDKSPTSDKVETKPPSNCLKIYVSIQADRGKGHSIGTNLLQAQLQRIIKVLVIENKDD
jgi:hypothetical protein